MAYCDRWSARPGDGLDVRVASPGPYQARLVRLSGVDTSESRHGRAVRTEVPQVPARSQAGRGQALRPGSYAHVDCAEADLAPARPAIDLWVRSSHSSAPLQCIAEVAHSDGLRWRLSVGGGGITLSASVADDSAAPVEDGEIFVQGPQSEAWVRVLAGVDPFAGRGWLVTAPAEPSVEAALISCGPVAYAPSRAASPIDSVFLAASPGDGIVVGHFNGRLENPRLLDLAAPEQNDPPGRVLERAEETPPLVDWDFASEMDTQRILDRGPNGLHGRLVNQPTRAVTGHRWRAGHPLRWQERPELFNAIHFHSDDLGDAAWETDFTLTLPPDLSSGLYGIELTQDADRCTLPVWVRPAGERRRVLFLAPTNTYLAYANEHLAHGSRGEAHERMMSSKIRLEPGDEYLREHPELGLSLYDTHLDGSGVVHSSRLRPILNLDPDLRTWLTDGRRHVAADLFILGWLDAHGVEYDVATDEDLDAEGEALLAPYSVVVTGSHPEYVTWREYAALQQYVHGTGNLMYLGANGFFWVTSYTDASRSTLECRRGYAAQRNWTSHPAEVHHASTGEQGGAWMHRGVNTRATFGVGMAAAGWGRASGYRRVPPADEDQARVATELFTGVSADLVGREGHVLGGAAGDELDSADFARGTPTHAQILLTSRHGPQYYPTLETVQSIGPDASGDANPDVRSDVVLLTHPGGGTVLSVGSICWAGSLAVDDYTGDVATLTANVLARMLTP